MRVAFDGEPLHGPALRDTLIDLTPAQAAAHPIPGAHSIWEIALHCTAHLRQLRHRLLGSTEPLGAADDWPVPPATDPHTWQAAIEHLEEAEARARELLVRTDPRRLVPGSGAYDGALHDEVVAALMHLAWHAGQITLLRRAQGLQTWNYNRAVDPGAQG
jgi:hypothetical protein